MQNRDIFIEKQDKKLNNNEKQEIYNQKLEILDSLNELKTELIDFKNNTNNFSSENLLGELLTYLRKNKYMSLLMICRDISEITIKDKIVEIEFNNDKIIGENYLSILKDYFYKKNLDIKIIKKVDTKNDVEILNKLFDGKLVIKN